MSRSLKASLGKLVGVASLSATLVTLINYNPPLPILFALGIVVFVVFDLCAGAKDRSLAFGSFVFGVVLAVAPIALGG